MVTDPRVRLPAQYEDMIAVKVDIVTDYYWVVMLSHNLLSSRYANVFIFLKFVLQNNEMVARGVERARLPKYFRFLSIGGDALSSRGRN